jgi:DNA-directed RNA polymerase specialized sigma24 family protein
MQPTVQDLITSADKGDHGAADTLFERISDALDELATHDAALAEIVDLRFFCGFSFAEIAALRGVSERTVKRNWEKSRIYLHGALGRSGSVV